jgi:uncharacterized membrane protein
MTLLAAAAQIIIALGIFNVWILRRNRATPYRPAGAVNIQEEFARYGLPEWACSVVGATKLSLAVLLLVGLAFAPVALPAAALTAVLMAGAIWAHVRVRDPIVNAAPAFAMLLLSTLVVVTYAI